MATEQDLQEFQQSEDVFEVEQIVDSRVEPDGSRMYRVRWKNYGPEEDTWEPKEHLEMSKQLIADHKAIRKKMRLEKEERKKQRRKVIMEKEQNKISQESTPLQSQPISESTLTENTDTSITNDKTAERPTALLESGMSRNQLKQLEKVLEQSKKESTKEIPKQKSKDSSTSESDVDEATSQLLSKWGDKRYSTESQPQKLLNKIPQKSTPSSSKITPLSQQNKSLSKPSSLVASTDTTKSNQIGHNKSKQSQVLFDISSKHKEITHIIAKPSVSTDVPITKSVISTGNMPLKTKQITSITSKQLSTNVVSTSLSHESSKSKDSTSNASKSSSSSVPTKLIPSFGSVPMKTPSTSSVTSPTLNTAFANAICAGIDKPVKKLKKHSKAQLPSGNKSDGSSYKVSAVVGGNKTPLTSAVTVVKPKSISSSSTGLSSVLQSIGTAPRSSTSAACARTTANQVTNRSTLNTAACNKTPMLSAKQKSSMSAAVVSKSGSTSTGLTSILSKPISATCETTNISKSPDISTTVGAPSVPHSKSTTSSTMVSFSKSASSITVSSTKSSSLLHSKPKAVTSTASLATSSVTTTSLNAPRPKKAKLTYASYQKREEERRKAQVQQQQTGVTMSFTQVPSVNNGHASDPRVIHTSNTTDRERIVQKPRKQHKQSAAAKSSGRRVPSVPSNTPINNDVVGSILNQISETVPIPSSLPATDPEVDSTDVVDMEISEEEAFREIEISEEDFDDYSGDEDGMLMFADNPSKSATHLDHPTANKIKQSHLVIIQRIQRGTEDDERDIKTYHISDIDKPTESGETLLMIAVKECNFRIVTILLEKNANPNVKIVDTTKKELDTPLMYAVELNQRPIVSILIQHGARLNTQRHGNTALNIACKHGYMEIIHLLLSHGVDVKPTEANLASIVAGAPPYLELNIKDALLKHTKKLRDITFDCMRELIPLGIDYVIDRELLMRCVLPNEEDIHEYFFEAKGVRANQPGTIVLLLCLPIVFEQNGQISVRFVEEKTGLDEVSLNDTTCLPVIPENHYVYFLLPKSTDLNQLKLITFNAGYKLLICVYTVIRKQ